MVLWMRAMHGSILGASPSRTGREGAGAASDLVGTTLGGGAERFAPQWQRRVVTALAAVVTLLVFAIVLGALCSFIPWLGVFGTILEFFSSLHIFLLGVIAIAFALWALRLGGQRATTVILWLAIASTGCAMIPIGALAGAAQRAGAPISWVDHLRVSAPGPEAEPNQTLVFATAGAKALYTDIYLPGKREALRGGLRAGGDDSRWRIFGRHAQHGRGSGTAGSRRAATRFLTWIIGSIRRLAGISPRKMWLARWAGWVGTPHFTTLRRIECCSRGNRRAAGWRCRSATGWAMGR